MRDGTILVVLSRIEQQLPTMAYRLKAKESLSTGIKRIATEQIEKATSELNNADGIGVGEAVHQARKRFKKTRAVIRLVRHSLGKKTYKQENKHFRNLGRSIADLRDGEVLIETLDNLTTRFEDEVTSDFTHIRRELRVDYRQQYQRIIDKDILVSVIDELKDSTKKINAWKIKSNDWSAMDKSFRQVYKRGYKDLDRVISKPTAENLHEWRKRIKYLRYQLQILSPMWSSLIKQWVDLTHD